MTRFPAFHGPLLGRVFPQSIVSPIGMIGCPDQFATYGLKHLRHFSLVLPVSIEDQVARCAVFGKGLSQLLHDPTARRMLRGIEVEDFPPAVADHEETVQDAKSCCWNCDAIHRPNPFPMLPQKRQPELAGVSLTAHSSQAPGDRALRNLKAQLQQLSMDSGGSPGGILLRHALDEVTNLRANLWSTTVPPLGKPTPIEP